MTKQPFLNDFPLTIFATAKRRAQAAIRRARSIISKRSLSGYCVLFEDELPGDYLEGIDPTQRQRSYGHIPVFWAWLAQILEANASCSRAGQPVMGMVGLLNLSHGGWEHFETCQQNDHEAKVATKMIKHLDHGDLLLGDRAFCSYQLIASSLQKGSEVLMRLHQARGRTLDWRKGKKIGPNERIVIWERPQQPPRSTMSVEEWQRLPSSITLRLIRFCYENREGNKARMVLVTSLLDHKRYDGLEVASLYHRRWEIELKLRDLKTTLGMECFEVKSPEMAHKTLWMSIIAFNLVRCLMQRAASDAGRPIWHVSFKGVLDQITASHEGFRRHAGKPVKRARTLAELIEICATKLIDIRPFRHEPRARKRRPKNYKLLTEHRSTFVEISHRNRCWKRA